MDKLLKEIQNLPQSLAEYLFCPMMEVNRYLVFIMHDHIFTSIQTFFSMTNDCAPDTSASAFTGGGLHVVNEWEGVHDLHKHNTMTEISEACVSVLFIS